MLITNFILLSILAFVCFLTGLILFSIFSFTSLDSFKSDGTFQKLGVPIILMFVCVVLFGILGVTAMDMETQHCDNQVTSEVTDGNTTNYTNDLHCETLQKSNPALGYTFGGFAALCAVLIFVYAGVYLIGE